MGRNDRARRRAAFGRLWEADAQAKSLAHGLELEDEAEREEEAASGPHIRRRARRWLVVRAVVAVFAVSTLTVLVLLVQGCQQRIFMHDHGVVVPAVIVDKVMTEAARRYSRQDDHLEYSFAQASDGRIEYGQYLVGGREFDRTRIGQPLQIIYNPDRPSQSEPFTGRPSSDLSIALNTIAIFAVWLIVFGGLCAVIVAVAWPEPTQAVARFRQAREAPLSR